MFYCKKHEHIVANCYALHEDKRPVKTVGLVKKASSVSDLSPVSSQAKLEVFALFLMDSAVFLTEEGGKIPITILRDTAASQSFIL